jgi:hypothetical protein
VAAIHWHNVALVGLLILVFVLGYVAGAGAGSKPKRETPVADRRTPRDPVAEHISTLLEAGWKRIEIARAALP